MLQKIYGGGYALSAFFMLSAYGIAKSEMFKPLGVLGFIKKRIWKLLKPYLIVIILIMVGYWLIGADYPIEDLAQYRVSEYFVLIGQHALSLVDYLMFIVNGKALSFHFWYVEVTIMAYVFFFISKSLFDIKTQRIRLFVCFSTLVLATGFILMHTVTSFPYLAMVRNTPMLLLGLFLALFEKDVLKSTKRLFILYVVFNLFIASYTFLIERSLIYVMYANYAMVTIWMLNQVMKHYELKTGSPIMLLSALSYVVYLIHSSFLTIEWWYIGFKSSILVVLASVLFAYAYQCVSSKKIIKIQF